MTGAGLDPQSAEGAKVAACAFCRKRLADEYYFVCRRCEGSYCYIHMSRHLPARCSPRRPVDVSLPVLAAAAGRGRSSANV